MKPIAAIAFTSLLALSAPAFAQSAGAPGATGASGSLTGSNTGTSNNYNYNNGYNQTPRERYYGPNDGGMYEGRAAAPDYGPNYYGPNYGAPAGAWRPQTEQQGVGADLVGPGSNADNPTDGYDVSR